MSTSAPFSPVPRQRKRHDGWSAAKQYAFIEALGQYGIVKSAAEKVGMNAASAYKLREAPGAASFARAWDAALKTGIAQLFDIAMDRAINGMAIPKYYKGEHIGEARWFDNRLLIFMMKQCLTRRFGPHAADFDFVEEELAIKAKRAEENRLALIKAQDLFDALQELLDYDCEYATEDEKLPRSQFDVLCAKKDRLEALIGQLTPDDPAKAVNYFHVNPADLGSTRRMKARQKQGP